MKIVFFDFMLEFGGATQLAVDVARRLMADHDIQIVDAYGACPAYVDALKRADIRTHVLAPEARNIYALGQGMTLEKQDYQGIEQAYEFDPVAERYTRVGDMTFKRWYPTLTGLSDGSVLAVSGLDGTGEILNGQNEIYDPATKTWTERKDLTQYFPSYPALFQTAREGVLFAPGYQFHCDGRPSRALRLTVAMVDEDGIRRGVATLGRLARERLRAATRLGDAARIHV